ncbi:MAG: gamma-glutamyltransferase [Planctomycetes bacterium]|nr:gamma-glutamyltransferase [Planctomycetota bacterium]
MSADPYIHNPGPKRTVTGLDAACSTDSAIVTETILGVLRDGGNAMDAAIAGCLVQAAVEPFMTNHTGTVTFLCYEARTRSVHQLDSSGTFPSGLPPFQPVPQGNGPYAAVPPSACIPGFMPGLKAIYERFGTRRWASLCADAIRWAEEGHPVSSFEYGLNVWALDFTTYFPEGRAFYLPGGFPVPVGERFRHPAMADTLRHVAEAGPDHMITGDWARAFVAKANQMGWPITLDHMTETPPRWVEPTRFPHQGFEVVGLGSPQMQGLFCALTLGILDHLDLAQMACGSADHLWAMGQALRVASQHWGYMGDDRFVGLPSDVLLDDAYHRSLARLLWGSRPKVDLTDLVATVPTTAFIYNAGFLAGGGKPTGATSQQERPSGSCELAIVDRDGNWVQMMNTLQSGGIPGMVVEGVPMVGSHAAFGLMTCPMEHKLVKGMRQRQTIGNTMVFKDGRPVWSLGSPGNVHCTVPQVLAYRLHFGLEPYAAADAPRMLPMTDDFGLLIEDRVSAEAQAGLARLGVRVKASPAYDFHMGSFQMCWRNDQGTLDACADPRRCGVADGLRA